MPKYILILGLILGLILISGMVRSTPQIGGETCACDPEGDDRKRCPNIPCKKPGLVLKYYATDREGRRHALIRSEIHQHPIMYNWKGGTILNSGQRDNVRLEFSGYIKGPVDGDLEFRVQSDDGIRVYVDEQAVIDQWKRQRPTYYNSSSVSVNKGQLYPFRVEWYDRGGGAVLKLWWRYSNGPWQPVPADAFSHSQ